jgi:ankyrin repeat protein
MPGIPPLSAAAQRGHLDTLLALVEDDRVEDNAQDDNCCTGLSFASANGHFDVVAALLSHKTIDVNRPERSDFCCSILGSSRKIYADHLAFLC